MRYRNLGKTGLKVIKYVHKLHDEGTIRHIGLSTHNPRIAKQAVESGFIEMILFSINPAFDASAEQETVKIEINAPSRYMPNVLFLSIGYKLIHHGKSILIMVKS